MIGTGLKTGDGSPLLSNSRGFEVVLTRYAPGATLPSHTHDFANISLVLEGGLEEESDHGVATVGAGVVVLKPAGTVHANRVGAFGAKIFALRIDPDWSAAKRLCDYLWCSGDAALAVMLRLFAESRQATLGEGQVRGVLSALCDEPRSAGFAGGPDWLGETQRRIHESNGDLDVRAMARHCDTHPVYLARAFRKHLGTSPREYVRRQRLTLAAHQLLTTDDAPTTIAADNGFADQAHFCRTFRRFLGLTPGAYRRIAKP